MYQLIQDPSLLENARRPEGIVYQYLMKPHDLFGVYQFLHGVNVEEHKGELFAIWARNEGRENSITEFTEYRRCKDGVWTPPLDQPAIRMPGEEGYGHSHGTPFSLDGKLYYFRPRIQGLGDVPYTRRGARMIRFLNLCTQVLQWQDDTETWKTLDCLIPDFIPTGVPKRTPQGNWIMGGVDSVFHACTVTSQGDDMTRWYSRYLFHNDEAYAETDVLVQGDTILALMRNEGVGVTATPDEAPLAFSEDGGVTWRYEWSNLPMSTSKPGCGVLSDGRPYFLFSYEAGNPRGRRFIYLGVGEKGSMSMNRVYLLDDGTTERILAYPYGKELNGTLYVGYSSTSLGVPRRGGNPNDAVLAAIPLSSL